MRLRGKRPGPVAVELLRVTFSPSANLIIRGASGMTASCGGFLYLYLMTLLSPPTLFALPCRISADVWPLARACQTLMPPRLRTSSMRTSAVMLSEPSLVPSEARCE